VIAYRCAGKLHRAWGELRRHIGRFRGLALRTGVRRLAVLPDGRQHRSQCSILVAVAPKLVGCVSMPVMIGHGMAPTHRQRYISTAPIARPSALPLIWPSSGASCRSTAIPASRSSTVISGSRPAGLSVSRSRDGRLRTCAAVLRRIAERYAIETTVRGQTAAARERVRQSKSLPLVAATKTWLNMQLNQIPPHSSLADAIRYNLTREGHPLPLPQKWPHRARHQYCRARDPSRHARP
jgi:Transposase IS66 family